MLCLKVDSPFNRVLEVSSALLEKLNCLGVGNLLIFAVSESVESVEESLFNKAVEDKKVSK